MHSSRNRISKPIKHRSLTKRQHGLNCIDKHSNKLNNYLSTYVSYPSLSLTFSFPSPNILLFPPLTVFFSMKERKQQQSEWWLVMYACSMPFSSFCTEDVPNEYKLKKRSPPGLYPDSHTPLRLVCCSLKHKMFTSCGTTLTPYFPSLSLSDFLWFR